MANKQVFLSLVGLILAKSGTNSGNAWDFRLQRVRLTVKKVGQTGPKKRLKQRHCYFCIVQFAPLLLKSIYAGIANLLKINKYL